MNTISRIALIGTALLVLAIVAGGAAGFVSSYAVFQQTKERGDTGEQSSPVATSSPSGNEGTQVIAQEEIYRPQTTTEEKIINAVRSASSSVVSISAIKKAPTYQEVEGFGFRFRIPDGEREQKIGSGTGFIVSEQ